MENVSFRFHIQRFEDGCINPVMDSRTQVSMPKANDFNFKTGDFKNRPIFEVPRGQEHVVG